MCGECGGDGGNGARAIEQRGGARVCCGRGKGPHGSRRESTFRGGH